MITVKVKVTDRQQNGSLTTLFLLTIARQWIVSRNSVTSPHRSAHTATSPQFSGTQRHSTANRTHGRSVFTEVLVGVLAR